MYNGVYKEFAVILENSCFLDDRWYDLIRGTTAEEQTLNEAEQVAQALRDSFYGKEESK